MVEQIANIKYIVTKNETESLILETNLIKEYLPKYNILMKD
jgi:excinuclease ABC subunit C